MIFYVKDVSYNFIYLHQTITSAMHEWDDKDINKGQKRIIALGLTKMKK